MKIKEIYIVAGENHRYGIFGTLSAANEYRQKLVCTGIRRKNIWIERRVQ